jgi:hypothetical protein
MEAATRTSANVSKNDGAADGTRGPAGRVQRWATETKQAFKTTEFWAFVGVVAMILVSAAAIKGGDDSTDQFVARQAWLFVAIVTGAYLIGRGLAKSGVREPYTDEHDRS